MANFIFKDRHDMVLINEKAVVTPMLQIFSLSNQYMKNTILGHLNLFQGDFWEPVSYKIVDHKIMTF